MAVFLDSSDPDVIRDLFGWGVLSGVTTNRLILAREAAGADLGERVKAILAASSGDVSVELTTDGVDAMLEEAGRHRAWDPARICVKVPMSDAGMRVVAELAKRGVRTNLTCLMSTSQAYLGALAGATYVSLFSGRVRDMGYDVRPIVASTRALLDREGLASRLLVGSIRHPIDATEALEAGAHVVTVTPDVLRKLAWNPRTDATVDEFRAAWRRRGDP